MAQACTSRATGFRAIAFKLPLPADNACDPLGFGDC